MTHNYPKVAIIILNWNGWQDTLECLGSLFKIDYPNYRVIIVDNGSTDDSTERIGQWSKGRIVLLPQKNNLGFARGNNVGIRYALANIDCEYLMVLNNDTTVDKNFLQPMLDVFKRYPKAGLAGPKIVDYYSKIHWQGVLRKRLGFFNHLMFSTPLLRLFRFTPLRYVNLVRGSEPERVYAISGCCMMFSRKAIEAIAFFDETTFLGWEEYIIAEKMLELRMETYVAPKSIICHKVARDTKKVDSVEKTLSMLRGERYFMNKYLKPPFWHRFAISSARMFIYTFSAVYDKRYRKNLRRIAKVLFGSGE